MSVIEKNAEGTQVLYVNSPETACLKDLADWCIRWGPFKPGTLFRSVEIRAGVDDVCVIKAEVYVLKEQHDH